MAEENKTEEKEQTTQENPETTEQQTTEKPEETTEETTEETQETAETFDAKKYIEDLDPEDNTKPDVEALKQQLKLAEQQRDALKSAYLQLKKTGVTVVSNPEMNTNGLKSGNNIDEQAQAMLDKYLNH